MEGRVNPADVLLIRRISVLLAFGTGLRMSELFGLKWHDIDFQKNEISVTRSIVFQVVGPCKTEASQKPVPLDPCLAEALHTWRQHTSYRTADDWVFASRAARGQKPYWGQCLMRTVIRPAAAKIGITKRIGWHTFRHTYSSLLRANRTDIKVTQELLRHASSRVTLDTYTQAVTPQKRKAQSKVVRLLRASTAAAGCDALGAAPVPSLCLREHARSRRKRWRPGDAIRIGDAHCAFFVPVKTHRLGVSG